MFIKIKKAQSTLEYAGLIAIVIASVITMQSFVRNHIQGKIKSSADNISDTSFDPGRTDTEQSTNLLGDKTEYSSVVNGVSETNAADYRYKEETTVNTTYDSSKF